MKLLSIAIPCYNSQDYMRHAIETLLAGGEDVEILVVNDGSKGKTADIAAEYQQKYPTIVRAINKENGGHGDAVMTGLKNATGLYFKVVDSDDWVDEESLKRVLAQLRAFTEQKEEIDMLICNYVYDKVGVKHKHVMQYRHAVPQNRVFGWNETRFKIGEYLLMHSVIYRTALLNKCGLNLPKHTFYVDELYVYQPLPMVKKMYYMDENLYHYFIGREDQSVQENVMIRRIDQALLVNRMLVTEVDLSKVTNKRKQVHAALSGNCDDGFVDSAAQERYGGEQAEEGSAVEVHSRREPVCLQEAAPRADGACAAPARKRRTADCAGRV